jgi:subtilisin family serine protease
MLLGHRWAHSALTSTSLTLAVACAPALNVYSASAVSRPAIPLDSAERATVTRTSSVALDRITKRAPNLDGTMRRVGTGRGVTVYVFDGGVNASHPELAGRVRKGYDAADHDEGTCGSHGTAVAGAVAGASLGVAPDANIVDVKIFSCIPLRGTVKSILDATDWVIDDHRAHPGPAVVNWSFVVDTVRGIPDIDDAVRRLLDSGMLVVVSAGNADVNACTVSPATAPGTLVVGALTLTHDAVNGRWIDRHFAGSAFGPCIDIYAPGDSVLLPLGQRTSVGLFSGTSFAAAYTSGAAAILLERSPALKPDELRAILCQRTSSARIADIPHQPSFLPTRVLYIGPVSEDDRAAMPNRSCGANSVTTAPR